MPTPRLNTFQKALSFVYKLPLHGERMAKRTDAELRADLIEVLDSIPAISASDIDVQVEAGMVTISGHVDTYQTRFKLERVARRVSGMRGLQINIRPSETVSRRTHSPHGSFG